MLLGLELDGSVCGILHSVNDGLADVVKSDEMRLLYGRDFFMEKLFDLEFKVLCIPSSRRIPPVRKSFIPL